MESYIDRLKAVLAPFKKVGIAFSGGVDSTLLLKAAAELLGAEHVVALTVKSPYVPEWEFKEAVELTKVIGVRHQLISVDMPEVVRHNPKDRCYLCKRLLFEKMLTAAKATGCEVLCDGTNFDDTKDYRPGLKALSELGVLSPLKEAGMTKAQIRELSNVYGLPTWDKPPYACLLTRIPYGVTVTETMLRQIETAEGILMKNGFKGVRVRHHGEVARIEIAQNEMDKMMDVNLMKKIHDEIGQLGFEFVTLDMGGYQTGCYNHKHQT